MPLWAISVEMISIGNPAHGQFPARYLICNLAPVTPSHRAYIVTRSYNAATKICNVLSSYLLAIVTLNVSSFRVIID